MPVAPQSMQPEPLRMRSQSGRYVGVSDDEGDAIVSRIQNSLRPKVETGSLMSSRDARNAPTVPTVLTDANIRENVIPDLNRRANMLTSSTPIQATDMSYGDTGMEPQVRGQGRVRQPRKPRTPDTSDTDGIYSSLLSELDSEDVGQGNYENDMAALIREMKRSNDVVANDALSSIERTFNVRRQQLDNINQSEQSQLRSVLRSMGSRYAPESSLNVMSAQERNDVLQLADLDAKEQAAIADVRNAQRDGNFRLLERALGVAENIRRERGTLRNKILEESIEENKKIRAQQMQAARDNSIAELFSQGITDPAEMLNFLNFDEQGNMVGDFTITEIGDALERLTGESEEATAAIKEYQFARSQGYEGSFIDFQADKDPSIKIDNDYKLEQIRKLQREAEDVGIDATTLDQAAREYVSTGKIPSWAPKDAIGAIIGTAKNIPLAPGTIVDATTGTQPSNVPQGALDDFSRLSNVINNLDELKTRFEDMVPGVIGGTIGAVVGADDQAEYMRLRELIIDDISRMQSGAALTKDEQEYYAGLFPGRFNNSFFLGERGENVIADIKKQLSERLETRLNQSNLKIVGQNVPKEKLDNAAKFDRAPLGPVSPEPMSIVIPERARIARVHNNPGNIKYAGQPGAEKGEKASDGGHFAKFPNLQAGFRAIENQIAIDANRGKTLQQFIYKYAPPSSNRSAEYLAFATEKTGAQPNQPLSKINRRKLAEVIAQKESSAQITYA